jgi:hypothetical protein
MHRLLLTIGAAAVASLAPLRAAAQTATASSDSVALVLDGNGLPAARTLSAADLSRLPRTELRVRGHHDTTAVTYAGVSLGELLRAAGAWAPNAPRGAFARSYVVVTADDDYRAVYALAELDTMVTDKVVLLADRKNGAPLDAAEGPLRIVAPGEKREGRWVRQVRRLTVTRVEGRVER